MRKGILWLALLLMVPMSLTLVSCKDDDDDDPNMVDVLRNDPMYSTFVSALERVDLDGLVNLADPITVFAPTNQAFVDLGVDLGTISDADLGRILNFHQSVAGRIESGDIASGKTYLETDLAGVTTAHGVSMLINNSGGTIRLQNTANVVDPDITSDNGVTHGINAVLMPPDVVDHAIANDDFSELVGALQTASGDLVNVLKGDGPFTVFAPVNAAFDEISDVVEGLNADQLAGVLTYHVVADHIRSSELSNGQVVTTVNGATFTVNISGSNVSLTDGQGNSANIVLTDVEATNGIIHVLDKVILP